MSFEILFPFGLWVFEPDWLLNHSQLVVGGLGLVLSINLVHCGNEFRNSSPVCTPWYPRLRPTYQEGAFCALFRFEKLAEFLIRY